MSTSRMENWHDFKWTLSVREGNFKLPLVLMTLHQGTYRPIFHGHSTKASLKHGEADIIDLVGINTYFLCYCFKNFLFAKSGEILTMRLRSMAFETMLKQVGVAIILMYRRRTVMTALYFYIG